MSLPNKRDIIENKNTRTEMQKNMHVSPRLGRLFGDHTKFLVYQIDFKS